MGRGSGTTNSGAIAPQRRQEKLDQLVSTMGQVIHSKEDKNIFPIGEVPDFVQRSTFIDGIWGDTNGGSYTELPKENNIQLALFLTPENELIALRSENVYRSEPRKFLPAKKKLAGRRWQEVYRGKNVVEAVQSITQSSEDVPYTFGRLQKDKVIKKIAEVEKQRTSAANLGLEVN